MVFGEKDWKKFPAAPLDNPALIPPLADKLVAVIALNVGELDVNNAWFET